MPPTLSTVSVSEVLRVIFGVSMVFTSLMTVVFYYHWGRYAPTHAGGVMAIAIYTSGIAVLILAMLGVLVTM